MSKKPFPAWGPNCPLDVCLNMADPTLRSNTVLLQRGPRNHLRGLGKQGFFFQHFNGVIRSSGCFNVSNPSEMDGHFKRHRFSQLDQMWAINLASSGCPCRLGRAVAATGCERQACGCKTIRNFPAMQSRCWRQDNPPPFQATPKKKGPQGPLQVPVGPAVKSFIEPRSKPAVRSWTDRPHRP